MIGFYMKHNNGLKWVKYQFPSKKVYTCCQLYTWEISQA